MSRTYVHRPIWVMERDPRVRHWFSDFHDHSDGTCDLHVYLAANDWVRTRCYRQPWTQAPNLCGCRLCTGQGGRKRSRRRQRARAKRALRETAKYNSADVDTPTDCVGPQRCELWF